MIYHEIQGRNSPKAQTNQNSTNSYIIEEGEFQDFGIGWDDRIFYLMRSKIKINFKEVN